MILQPSRSSTRSQVIERYRQAPIRGVNRADHIRSLEGGQFAQVIENFICRPRGLVVRPGYAASETLDAGVTSLLSYPKQVLARTDGDWIGETLANPGGAHLLAAKGDATPIHYNGTAWADACITGVDPALIDGVISHVGRFWGFLKGDLEVVYLPRRQFGGEALVLPMHALFPAGGEIVALASMTNDGGEDGRDSLCVATSEGELAIYDGPNPDFRETFRLRGVYEVPKPVGRRAFTRMAGQIALLTEDGLINIPQALAAHKSRKSAQPVSRNVGSIAAAETVLDSAHQKVTLIHAGDEQWVRDPETQGWSRFLHLDATCWLEGHDGLYFGKADGTVNKMQSGATDGAENVTVKTLVIDAFSQFRVGRRKVFHRVRPHYELAQPYQPRMELLMDYRNVPTDWDAARTDHKYWFWDDINWERQPMHWLREVSARLGQWRGIAGEGDAAALVFGGQFLSTEAAFLGYDAEFEMAGGR